MASSLYRGVVPPLLGVTPIFAVSFWVGRTAFVLVLLLMARSPGLRYVQAAHPGRNPKQDKQRVVDTRARNCGFPVRYTHHSCHRAGRAGEGALAGPSLS